jgi:hypothetical protein
MAGKWQEGAMRIAAAYLIAATVLTGSAARAGSVETFEAASASGPSIVTIIAQAGQATWPSVVTLGVPAVTDEKVSSIGTRPAHKTADPLVIRGGAVGGATAN